MQSAPEEPPNSDCSQLQCINFYRLDCIHENSLASSIHRGQCVGDKGQLFIGRCTPHNNFRLNDVSKMHRQICVSQFQRNKINWVGIKSRIGYEKCEYSMLLKLHLIMMMNH